MVDLQIESVGKAAMPSIPEWGNLLKSVQLTGSGRPRFIEGEVECCILDGVDLQIEDSHYPVLREGLAILTTHRILWVDEKGRRAGAISLASVSHMFPVKKSLKSMFSKPRLRFLIRLSEDGSASGLGPQRAPKSLVITLVLRGQTPPDLFVSRASQILASKGWETSVVSQPSSSGVNLSFVESRPRLAVVGLNGILRKEQEEWEATDRSLKEAFQDLNALMSKAKEMVKLAEKMRSKLLAGPSIQSGGNDEEIGSRQEMQDWLLSVGITSPVTKETAGALYHQQLSRQLADFVKIPLERSGGIMSVVDIYCMFNRARGTELISPEDLLQACAIWEKIDVPVIFRQFDSGVKVIQSKSQSDDEVFARIRDLVQEAGLKQSGVGASDAARMLGFAPALAKEYLLAAENKGLLCRDDGPDGLRFYINFFKEIDPRSVFV
eukprot:TRINITY_DN7092_c0_g1_i1.p1 TRINITY_DN7092_c0_g1~~TRINITY_DN7092_c0_g1_i1.p1  ORF type:complete len:437 (+),score=83.60 TRINITY_DN7092_c0_g1_i1:177-1487(+)